MEYFVNNRRSAIIYKYFHFKVFSFDAFKLLKFVTFVHIEFCMPKVILKIFDEFCSNFDEIYPKTCKISKKNFIFSRITNKGKAKAKPLLHY